MLRRSGERPKGSPRSEAGVTLPASNIGVDPCVGFTERMTLDGDRRQTVAMKLKLPDPVLENVSEAAERGCGNLLVQLARKATTSLRRNASAIRAFGRVRPPAGATGRKGFLPHVTP